MLATLYLMILLFTDLIGTHLEQLRIVFFCKFVPRLAVSYVKLVASQCWLLFGAEYDVFAACAQAGKTLVSFTTPSTIHYVD